MNEKTDRQEGRLAVVGDQKGLFPCEQEQLITSVAKISTVQLARCDCAKWAPVWVGPGLPYEELPGTICRSIEWAFGQCPPWVIGRVTCEGEFSMAIQQLSHKLMCKLELAV